MHCTSSHTSCSCVCASLPPIVLTVALSWHFPPVNVCNDITAFNLAYSLPADSINFSRTSSTGTQNFIFEGARLKWFFWRIIIIISLHHSSKSEDIQSLLYNNFVGVFIGYLEMCMLCKLHMAMAWYRFHYVIEMCMLCKVHVATSCYRFIVCIYHLCYNEHAEFYLTYCLVSFLPWVYILKEICDVVGYNYDYYCLLRGVSLDNCIMLMRTNCSLPW